MTNNIKNNNLIVDGWVISDLPIPYTEKDYDEARAEVTRQAENTPEMSALFEYGYIPVLGISDMDFWAVFPDDGEKMYISKNPVLTPKTKQVMMHQMALINESHYRKMLYFDPWTTIRWPDGHRLLYKQKDLKRDVNFEHIEFSDEDKDILSMMYIEECLVSMFPAIPLYARKELRVRNIFETIKNCVYIIEEINRVANEKIGGSFSDDFKQLRAGWFELPEQEAIQKLIDIFHRGLLIMFEAAFVLGKWVDSRSQKISVSDLGIRKTGWLNWSGLGHRGKNVYLNTFKQRRLYTDDVKTPQQALELSVRSCKKINIHFGSRSLLIDFWITFLPLGMSALLLGSLSSEGLLSKSLKRDIFTNTKELPIFTPQVFKDKSRMIDEITGAYYRKQVPNTNGKGWIYGNNHFGYSFGKETIKMKLIERWLKIRFWWALWWAK